MSIEITSNAILKPCPSAPPHPLTNSLVPLTIFDLAAMDLHVPTVHAFRAPMPQNSELRDGLSRALTYYPHLAGRLIVDERGEGCISLNNEGVRFVEAEVDLTLAEVMPLEGGSDLSKLHPPIEGVKELLQVQLNRYKCGGVIIGFTCHHRTADGASLSQFLLHWSELVRNPNTPIPSPYLDRSSICQPRTPPQVKFNHLDVEFKKNSSNTPKTPKKPITSSITNFSVHFSAQFIQSLKSKISGRSSTFECLLSHMWRKITIARCLNQDEITQIRVAVNGRARIKPPVPGNFFGNLVLWAYPQAVVQDLIRYDIAETVAVIREAIGRVDDEYFKSFIDFGEVAKRGEVFGKLLGSAPESGTSLCPNLEVDSWLRFDFHELDFGSRGPCAFMPPNLPVEGLMVFVPSYKEKGGVDVFMALFEEHVEGFKTICYSLD